MTGDAGGGEVGFAPLFAVDENDGMFDDEADRAEAFDTAEDAAGFGDQIFDDHHALAGLPEPFDIFAQAVGFGFFAWVDHGDVGRHCDRGADRQGSVGHTSNAITGQIEEDARIERRSLRQQEWLTDQQAQVNIDR